MRIVITVHEARDVSPEHVDLNCVVQDDQTFLAACVVFPVAIQHLADFLADNLGRDAGK